MPEKIEVIAPNLKRRLSGVTATIVRLLPVQACSIGIVATGPGLPAHVPYVPLRSVIRMSGRACRVWYARRNTEMFHPPPDRCAHRRSLGLSENVTIGCYGRIRRQKGTDVFVDAMLEVLPQHVGVTALVMGRAAHKHGLFLQDLREKVARAGLQDRILFLPEVPVEEMPRWYQALDLLVAPQRWEGFGLTPLEAMACGVPVIATTVGAFDELVVEGETGCLIPQVTRGGCARRSMQRLPHPPRCSNGRRRPGATLRKGFGSKTRRRRSTRSTGNYWTAMKTGHDADTNCGPY